MAMNAGDGFYVVEEGTFSIYKTDGSEEIARAGPGSSFGELALLRSEPRAATVKAITRSPRPPPPWWCRFA